MANPPGSQDRLVQRENRTRTITPGRARGRLVGGNLTVLTALVGSPYVPSFDGAILFLEDVREDIYRVDRMLTQLRLAGLLGRVRGFVFGSCSKCGPGGGLRLAHPRGGPRRAREAARRPRVRGGDDRPPGAAVHGADRRRGRDGRRRRHDRDARARGGSERRARPRRGQAGWRAKPSTGQEATVSRIGSSVRSSMRGVTETRLSRSTDVAVAARDVLVLVLVPADPEVRAAPRVLLLDHLRAVRVLAEARDHVAVGLDAGGHVDVQQQAGGQLAGEGRRRRAPGRSGPRGRSPGRPSRRG